MHGGTVSSSEQSRACRCADGGGVEIGVAQTVLRKLIEGGRRDLAAKRAGSTESDVIEQYPHDVGRACRGFDRIRPPLLGVGQCPAYLALVCLLSGVTRAHERNGRGQRRDLEQLCLLHLETFCE